MHLIRFLSAKDEILYGEWKPQHPESARIIDGDIFTTFSVNSREEKIIKILAPVTPPNILAIGLNYRKHADETNIRYPEEPVLFIKAATSIIGLGDPVLLPKIGPDEVDYEGELAVVIGKEAKNISSSDAVKYILGYTCANDISARDWQVRRQKKQWARGKSFDTFCPAGPCIVTADSINPDSLKIQTILNGKTLQNSNTSDMIFTAASLVSHLSQSMTLLPGTLILTGTPEGVGFTREPPVFLKENDVVSVIIEGIGELRNRVLKEV